MELVLLVSKREKDLRLGDILVSKERHLNLDNYNMDYKYDWNTIIHLRSKKFSHRMKNEIRP